MSWRRWPRILCAALLACLIVAAPSRATEEQASFGRFGQIRLYYASPHPSRVILFVSGDGGWNLGVVDMARTLEAMDALVVGINITHYLAQLEAAADKCSYPASDFEELSKFVQQKLGYPEYAPPTLVGYSSGATLVYATLVQAPATTFRGAISMGFCPDLPLTKPFCKGSGLEWTAGPRGKGFSFLPARTLEVPWIAFQGTIDQVCDPAGVTDFVKQVPMGEVVMLPKVGHGFSVPRNWEPQFRDAVSRLSTRPEPGPPPAAVEELRDLPLVELASNSSGGVTMAVIVTGDGGWGVTDRGIGSTLAGQGVPVVGLNSLRYFWQRRTPEEAASALERILRHYLAAWQKPEAILIGYSLGAEVLPFMANRLPPDLLARVKTVVLMGPGPSADFQFHFADWLGNFKRKTDLPVLPEIERLKGKRIVCFYGEEEDGSLCPKLGQEGLARVIVLPGGHRIGSRFAAVADTILSETR